MPWVSKSRRFGVVQLWVPQLAHRGSCWFCCCLRDRTAQQFIQFPCLIVEVLSPSTEAYDFPLETLRERGGKFKLYRRLASLQEYVLVGSETKTVEIFRRNPSGSWEFMAYGEGDDIPLTSVGLTVAIEVLYEDVVLAPVETIQLPQSETKLSGM